MRIVPEILIFEWDKGNKEKSLEKHGLTNREIEEVFTNKPFQGAKDVRHSLQELRYQALGKTNEGKRLFVVFTIRAHFIRIISARHMNKKERTIYESY